MTAVNVQSGDAYSVNGIGYAPAADGQHILIEAMTDAGDGAGQTVASASVVIDGVLAPGIPAGRLWLAPGQLSGGDVIAPISVSIPLRQTVRERIKILVRF